MKDLGNWKIVDAETGKLLGEIITIHGIETCKLKCICRCHKRPESVVCGQNNYCRVVLSLDQNWPLPVMVKDMLQWTRPPVLSNLRGLVLGG